LTTKELFMKRNAQRQAAAIPALHHPWDAAGDAGRAQAAIATGCATAMFRGFEAMRRIQETAARTAAQRHASATLQLRADCAPAEMARIQSELLRSDVESAAAYWQQLFGAALEMQAQMLVSCSQVIDSETVLEATSALESIANSLPFATRAAAKA
jgi:hypothetical protein